MNSLLVSTLATGFCFRLHSSLANARVIPASQHPLMHSAQPLMHQASPLISAETEPWLKLNYTSDEIRTADAPELLTAQRHDVSLRTVSSPHFQVIDAQAWTLLGKSPSIKLLLKGRSSTLNFAQGAATYFPDDDSVWFAGPAGQHSNGAFVDNEVYKIDNLTTLAHKVSTGQGDLNQDFAAQDVTSPNRFWTNGGNPYADAWLITIRGLNGSHTGGVALVERTAGHVAETLIDNFGGFHFNSPSGVVVHPTSGFVFFTDPDHDCTQHLTRNATLRPATYAFSPLTGQLTTLDVRTVVQPGSLAFSPEVDKLYISDISTPHGHVCESFKAPSLIYSFDVVTKYNNQGKPSDIDVTHSLSNGNILASVASSMTGSIKVDSTGNIWTATSTGVEVFLPTGKLAMKVFLPSGGAADIVFAGMGRLIVLARTQVWLIQLNHDLSDPGLFGRPGPQQEAPWVHHGHFSKANHTHGHQPPNGGAREPQLPSNATVLTDGSSEVANTPITSNSTNTNDATETPGPNANATSSDLPSSTALSQASAGKETDPISSGADTSSSSGNVTDSSEPTNTSFTTFAGPNRDQGQTDSSQSLPHNQEQTSNDGSANENETLLQNNPGTTTTPSSASTPSSATSEDSPLLSQSSATDSSNSGPESNSTSTEEPSVSDAANQPSEQGAEELSVNQQSESATPNDAPP
ncbi:unnamed protein product [Sympodiomycopsis kandeliae]